MISLAQVFRPADEDAEAADEVRIERANANARERADATMGMLCVHRSRAEASRGFARQSGTLMPRRIP